MVILQLAMRVFIGIYSMTKHMGGICTSILDVKKPEENAMDPIKSVDI